MTEQLTDEERDILANLVGPLPAKALLIADALTAENAALRVEVERLRREADWQNATQMIAFHRHDALTEAGHAIASEDRPTAARFWVEKWRLEENHQDSGDWYMSKVDKALAAQPAAPALMRNPLDPKFKGKNEG